MNCSLSCSWSKQLYVDWKNATHRDIDSMPRISRPPIPSSSKSSMTCSRTRCSNKAPTEDIWERRQINNQTEKGRTLTQSGDDSAEAKFDNLIDAFQRFMVGSPSPLSLRLFIKSYAFLRCPVPELELESESDVVMGDSSSESKRSESKRLRPLAGLNSLWGLIWNTPPAVSTVKSNYAWYQGVYARKI